MKRTVAHPLDVKAGDLILFGKCTSQEIKLDGEGCLIMREDEVFAVIDGAQTKPKTKPKTKPGSNRSARR